MSNNLEHCLSARVMGLKVDPTYPTRNSDTGNPNHGSYRDNNDVPYLKAGDIVRLGDEYGSVFGVAIVDHQNKLEGVDGAPVINFCLNAWRVEDLYVGSSPGPGCHASLYYVESDHLVTPVLYIGEVDRSNVDILFPGETVQVYKIGTVLEPEFCEDWYPTMEYSGTNLNADRYYVITGQTDVNLYRLSYIETGTGHTIIVPFEVASNGTDLIATAALPTVTGPITLEKFTVWPSPSMMKVDEAVVVLGGMGVPVVKSNVRGGVGPIQGIVVTPGETNLAVTWTADDDADSYEVWWNLGTSVATDGSEATTTVTTTSHDITGIAAGTQFTIRVRGIETGEDPGDWSNPVVVRTNYYATPQTPTLQTPLTVTDTSIEVLWAISGTTTSFEVWINEGSSIVPGTETVHTTGNVTQYTISGLTAETTYAIRVRAYRTGAEFPSAWSNVLTHTTNPEALPTPQNLRTAPGGEGRTTIVLQWNAVTVPSALTNGNIEIAFNPGSSIDESHAAYTVASAAVGSTTITIGPLAEGTQHIFRARVVDNDGVITSSDWSNTVTAYTTLAAPANVSVTPTSDGGWVTWDGVTNADHYDIDWQEGTVFNTNAGGSTYFSGQTSNSYTISGLTASTDYVVRVRAANSGATVVSAFSTTVQFTTSDPVLEGATLGIVAGSVQNDEVQFSWNAVTGAESYTLYVNEGDAQTAEQIIAAATALTSTVTSPGQTISGLSGNTDYEAVVVATATGVTNGVSNVVSFTTLRDRLAAPTGLTVTAGANDGELVISWDAVLGAAEYRVYYEEGTSLSSSAIEVIETTTSLTVTGLTVGGTYAAEVRAYSIGAHPPLGEGSGTVTGQAAGTPTLGQVSNIWATGTAATSTNINFATVTNAESYTLYYEATPITGTFPENATEVTGITASPYALTGLTSGTTYHAAIKAVATGYNDGALSFTTQFTTT